MPPPLVLASITAVSPTLAEMLRLCPLRAGLWKADGADQYVLGHPRAWLGTAYHAVLEEAGRVNSSDEGRHETTWVAAIDRQNELVRLHPLNRRFGPPERWPGYYLVKAMALLRGQEIGRNFGTRLPAVSVRGKMRGREQWLSAAGGRLVGRPDLLSDDAVIDYKTGDIYEDGDTKVAKAAYVRQLQFYAFLVKESTGKWPARGVLLPMQGPPLKLI